MLLETPRLRLRDFDPDRDAPALYALNLDPEVVRYTGDGPFESVAATRDFFAARVAEYARLGMGRWLVELRATGEPLGWCGLKRLPPSDPRAGEVDLAYRFFRRHWGHGYATEASRVCLDYGFGPLGLPKILIRARAENTASLNVARKLGARQVPEPQVFNGETYIGFVLTPELWRQAQASGGLGT